MLKPTAVCWIIALMVTTSVSAQGIRQQTMDKEKAPAAGRGKTDEPSEEKTEKTKKSEVQPGLVPSQSRTVNGPTYSIAMRGLSYSPGEVIVKVHGNLHPVIGIGMAASGVTVVEFPATDKFFAVHPPRNGDWIEVEKSPSMKSDAHLVLRAGRDLMNAPGPAASISVQMRSGLIVTLWVYPVKTITQQTHRLIVSYSCDEVVATRQRAGLAVNLGENEEREVATAASSDTAAAKPPEVVPASQLATAAAASSDGEDNQQTPPAPHPTPQSAPSEQLKESRSEEISKSLRGMLKDVAANPKGFRQWSGATNGISVATQMRDLDGNTSVALVAVKNVETDQALRLMSGHPELVVQTLDGKGKIVQLERVKQLETEATTSSNIIPAKATVYFAIAYAPPVLGKQQRLTVTVGQMNAADDPAIAATSANK
jgi:hypothetical protein